MASAPRFHSSITATSSEGALSLVDESALAKISIRAGADTPTGLAMGAKFGGSRTVDGVLIAGIRPDEWWVIGEQSSTEHLLESVDLSGFANAIDMTHGRACIRIIGADAARALEKVCNLDFSDPMTPNGAAMSASVAKVGCDLVRDDVERDRLETVRSYLVLVDRSFGQYLYDSLRDATQEFDN